MERALIRLLRHTARDEGLPVDSEGFVPLSYIQKVKGFRHLTEDWLIAIVNEDTNGRFKLRRQPDLHVGAQEGHSMRVQPAMWKVSPPVIIHGTNREAWTAICYEGIRTMGRQYIHMCSSSSDVFCTKPTTTVLIYLSPGKMYDDGMVIYQTDNGILLSCGDEGLICACYFDHVIDRITSKPLAFFCNHHTS